MKIKIAVIIFIVLSVSTAIVLSANKYESESLDAAPMVLYGKSKDGIVKFKVDDSGILQTK